MQVDVFFFPFLFGDILRFLGVLGMFCVVCLDSVWSQFDNLSVSYRSGFFFFFVRSKC